MGALTMTAKVCPRCGEQYENLKSATCPQCFARLLVVDEATAEELAAARAAVMQTPEFQAVKEEDDERFRQQSFGACLGVVSITLATLVLIVVLLVVAVHRYGHHPHQGSVVPTPPGIAGNANSLTALPVAGASLDDVMPPVIGPYQRRSLDQDVTLPGTTTPIFHAVYAGLKSHSVDVYALSAGRPTPELNEYALALTLAARQSGPSGRSLLFFTTEHWRYAAVSAGNSAAFRDALIAHFQGP
jgi:hypothetical protein